MTSNYEVVIGLEVHVELSTRTKVWCSCANQFGAEPNSNVCPVCLGLPGALPVLNEKALEYAMRAGLALNCHIAGYTKFDRKNYFYPDNPTAYQISQYDLPICHQGYLDIAVDGQQKRIGITRIHLENDAGKSLHAGDDIAEATSSLMDFNRAGVPLLEIVSEPDMRSAEEARAYLEKLQRIVKYTGVSDVRMEEGSMRCDVNVSIRPLGATAFGTRCEIKNVNSLRAVVRAVEYEVKRQIKVVEGGGAVDQETRSWNEDKGITTTLRSKEDAQDYRYFPEPDLPPVVVSPEQIEQVRKALPELPDTLKERFVTTYGLSDYDAELLVAERPLAEWFQAATAAYAASGKDAAEAAKLVANWMLNELAKYMNAQALDSEHIPMAPAALVRLLKLMDAGTISGKIAKTVFEEMCASGQDAETVVREKGLVQVQDEGEIARVALEAIAANPKVVEDYKAGKPAAAQFLVGQVMKATKGKANPQLANKIILEKLKEVTGQ